MRGPAFDACADVEQHRRPPPRRHRRRERRPIDAGEHAEGAVRRHHRRARMPGAEERSRAPARDRFRGQLDRGRRFTSQRRRRRFSHVDDVGGIHDLHASAIDVGMSRELGVDRRRPAHQRHAQIEVPYGRQRAVDDVARGVVAAHGVYCNPNHRDSGFGIRDSGLFFLNRTCLAAAVIPAVRADAVRRLRLVTVRALGEADRLQRVMRPALGGPGLGMSSLWIRHR